jgi:uncharacterized membrane protein
MADLIVLGFKDTNKADEVIPQVQAMISESYIEVADWARVIRREDGKIDVRQAQNLPGESAVAGALLGMLIGLLFLMPLAGLLAGGATGAVLGHFSDLGIDDTFITDVGRHITPGSSALFLYVTRLTEDRFIERLRPYEPTVLRTSLSHDAENRLRASIERRTSA